MLVCVVVGIANGGAVETSGHSSAFSSTHDTIIIIYHIHAYHGTLFKVIAASNAIISYLTL